MATRTARSVDRTVEKMLRRMAKTSGKTTATTRSASTAAQALEHMAEIQKRVARGDMEGAYALAGNVGKPPTTTGDVASSGTPWPVKRPQAHTGRKPRSSMGLLVVGGIVATSLLGGLFALSLPQRTHSVSGTITLDRRPLSKVELAFQLRGDDCEPIRVVTSEGGDYKIDSMPAGEYSIFLTPSDPGVKLPKKYLSPQTTPFRLKVMKDLSGLRMLAVGDKARR